MTIQDLFKKRQYINLETYRKSGEAMRTPVWFAQEGSTLYVWTDGQSGKVKRIRRNGRVRVAPSDARGNPLGEFVDAQAALAPFGTELYQRGNRLMDKKYGILKKAFELMGSGKKDRMVIAIQLAL